MDGVCRLAYAFQESESVRAHHTSRKGCFQCDGCAASLHAFHRITRKVSVHTLSDIQPRTLSNIFLHRVMYEEISLMYHSSYLRGGHPGCILNRLWLEIYLEYVRSENVSNFYRCDGSRNPTRILALFPLIRSCSNIHNTLNMA